jgi:hypothetical protein
MTTELEVVSDNPEEDRAWWSMVTYVEEGGGAVNGSSWCHWSTTWAATGCHVMMGRCRTRSSTQTAMEGDGGGARWRAERWQRQK